MPEYIEREALLDDIDAAMKNGGMGYVVCQTLKRYVKRQQSADVAQVRHGRWVPYHDSDFGWDEYGYKCSACNYRVERDEFTFAENFCPLCGAKMDLEG